MPREHPRLFGSLERLRALASERSEAFVRMDEVALERQGGDMEYLFSAALASAVTGDDALARDTVAHALKIVHGSIRVGHETFGKDLTNCAVVFNLCRAAWTESEVAEFINHMNRTIEANQGSELTVFHNGFYSYQNAGIGIASYATYYENPRVAPRLAPLKRGSRGCA